MTASVCSGSISSEAVSTESTHPGVSAQDVKKATGFKYIAPEITPVTEPLDDNALRLLRTEIAHQIAETYPGFAARNWGVGQS